MTAEHSSSQSLVSPQLLREGYLAGRPFESDRAVARLAPFMLVAVAAIAAAAILGQSASEEQLLLAAGITALDFVVAVTVPWARLPPFLQAVPPLAFFAVVGLLRTRPAGAPP